MGLFDKIFNNSNMQKNNSNQQVAVLDSVSKGLVETNKLFVDSNIIEKLKLRYIALDFETTGLNPYNDRIIEIGAILFENGEIKERFHTLVNSGKNISAEASIVNGIANEMLILAPSEEIVYPSLLEFLGNALNAETILCAHNASFDIGFLSETLMRLGYNANINFVDTLSLSRKLLKGLQSYKQDSIANYFEIINEQSHRAISDAETCGKIMWNLIQLEQEEIEKTRQYMERCKPNNEELEICAFIQNIIIENGGDAEYLRFIKNSGNYVNVIYSYSLVKFKFTKKGNYIILPKKVIKNLNFIQEPCTLSEGGTEYVRMYFNSPFDIEYIKDYLLREYKSCRRSVYDYIDRSSRREMQIKESLLTTLALSETEVETLLTIAKEKDYVKIDDSANNIPIINSYIKRSDITIKPKNTRVPLNEILNSDNWNKGFDAGYKYWEQGDIIRKDGNLELAIQMYDKARYNGYSAPVLYESYAMAFNKLKDYDNEIDILDEGIKREKKQGVNISRLEARRDKAVELLYKQQELEKQKLLKEEMRIKKIEEKKLKEEKPQMPKGRSIIQFDDNMTIIRKYKTTADAVRETGINSKSIRDAANGIQKRAGGYIWKFADEYYK